MYEICIFLRIRDNDYIEDDFVFDDNLYEDEYSEGENDENMLTEKDFDD